jgi:two-component system, OmpR family, sensor histidine kinase KdpD
MQPYSWSTTSHRSAEFCATLSSNTADPSTAIHQTPELWQLPAEERQAIEKHLRFARSLQIGTRILGGSDIATTVVNFARQNQVTQIFVAHTQIGLLERLRRKNFTEDSVRLAQELQVTVVADRSRRRGA